MAVRLPLSISFVLVALAQATMPDGVAVQSCEWANNLLHVQWEAPEGALSDYYEVQLSSTAAGQAFSIFSTAALTADAESLLPHTTYWVRVRAHSQGAPSLGPGTWGSLGDAKQCQTGASSQEAQAIIGVDPSTVTLEVMRESEFTYDVDYLMNHNSGSLLGDVAFLTFSSTDPTKPGFLNVSLKNATFTLFCVDIASVKIPDTITTAGNSSFADYLSCNDNGNATDPQCECDNWIDRGIGGLDPNKYCHQANGSACSPAQHGHDCQCKCSASSSQYSSMYTGMMPVKFRGPQIGVWYSHPKAAECAEHNELGKPRPDGTTCTWKRRQSARVLRGWQVLDEGWNATMGHDHATVDPAQVAQNAAAVRKAFARQPMLPWDCSTGITKSHSTLIV